jgi:hypothetical protein
MATVGFQSIKVNGAVSASVSSGAGTTAPIYTAPANGYAMVNVSMYVTVSGASAGINYVVVGGRRVMTMFVPASLAGVTTPSYDLTSTRLVQASPGTIFVGPGQELRGIVSIGTIVFDVSGVEFVNS